MADLSMNKPTENTEVAALRNLFEAVLEAVTVPHDADDYSRRMCDRAEWVQTTVRPALDEDPADLDWNADYLRGMLAAEQAEADKRAKKTGGAQ